MSWASLALLCPLLLSGSTVAVTVYGQAPLAATSTTPGAAYTGLRAYDPTVLQPPPLPSPAPGNQFNLQLTQAAGAVQGLSVPLKGSFWGFSIEVSVINQVLGKNSSFLQVPFLNLMSTHAKRSGEVHIRVGGNTQDYATLVDAIPDGRIIEKLNSEVINNPTATPPLLFTRDVFYLMNNITSLVPVKWYMGIPLNDTQNLRLAIAEEGERILGSNILGFQIGNEPDLYARHQHRPLTYKPSDYFGEFADVVNAIAANDKIPTKNNLIGPSIANADWQPQDVWDTGFITTYAQNLLYLSVERYPTDNCFVIWGPDGGTFHDPQATFPSFLAHDQVKNLVNQYLPSTALAVAAGKPFVMFETNTASCGGFPGISDSFGAGLWVLDYGLNMAAGNFSEALLHVGGQDTYYNPFAPPPTGESQYNQWTINPIFMATLVTAEIFGQTGTSRIIDLNANNGDVHTPAYAVYENDVISKVVIINFMTDATGASDSSVTISIGGGETGQPNGNPASVQVKYFVAPSVSSKADNTTWGGQGYGAKKTNDGRLKGDEQITTVNCDQNANTCVIHVPAPGAAVVFLNSNVNPKVDPANTYSTTAYTQTYNTIRADPSLVAHSNGHNGKSRQQLGATSFGSSNGASSSYATMRDAALLGSALLAVFVGVVGL